MPFFENEDYMRDVSRFWIWAVLTVPSTAILFFVFIWWRTRRLNRLAHKAKNSRDREGDEELGKIG